MDEKIKKIIAHELERFDWDITLEVSESDKLFIKERMFVIEKEV